jgi:hypothetical protein
MSATREIRISAVHSGVSHMDGVARYEVYERDMSRPWGERDTVLGTFGPDERDAAHDLARAARVAIDGY